MNLKYLISIIVLIVNIDALNAQLDNLHYLPPLKQAKGNSTSEYQRSIDDQVIYLSTPETTSFTVDVYLGTSTSVLTSFTLINGSPVEYTLPDGDNEITLVSNVNTGIILSNSGLRFESPGGENFYVNYRGRSINQAGSLTSKGKSALGTEFRWGGLPNNPIANNGIIDQLSNSLGIMATEDNTLVVISGYDTDCVFREGTNASGITSNTITRILNKGQSFVLEALPSETNANYSGWMGTSITSDNPIVLSLGGLNVSVSDQSAGSSSSRDVGIDQIVPIEKLGKEYAIVKARGIDAAEFAVAVAHNDNTKIYAGDLLIGEIDDGEYLIIDASNFNLPDPPIIIGGNVIDDGIGNMFVSSDKSFYLYQCIAGQEGLATIGMNFVAPVNCFLPDNLDEIPLVNQLPNYSGSIESAIVITADASILRSDIQIFQNGVALTQAELDAALFEGSDLINRNGDPAGWKTYGIQLVGNVKVEATGPIAVSLLVGFGQFGGMAGFFSGFGNVPDVDIQLTSSHCVPGVLLSETSTNYDAYQWYYEDAILSGETSSTITPTQDGDYFLEVTSGSCTFTSNNIDLITCPTSIDFDGVDDYVQTSSVIDDVSGVSSMAWVNLKNTFSAKGYVLGEDDFKLYVNNDLTLGASVTTDQGIFSVTTTNTITTGEWVHLAIIYDSSSLKIYINGSEVASNSSILGTLELNSTDFFIGKNPAGNLDYLEGYVQEVKVFGKALTATQLQEQVYQTIVSNNGNVMGEITSHDIENLLWSDLKLYLKLTYVEDGFTPDASDNNETNALYNIETIQETTAPLPYVANASGAWSTEGTWEHGDVWDIENLPNKDWSIVELSDNTAVTTTNSHTNLGLILRSGSELKVQNGQLLQNTRYLKIDGGIDLVDESQLIQTTTSILDVTSTGIIVKDQDGNSSLYNYNYWSSPVSGINNVENNKNFSVSEVLKDGTNPSQPESINFNTTGYDGAPTIPITIADYWIFTFMNFANDYSSWQQVRSTGEIQVGQGYSMKGTGSNEATQNYIFVGKPNNGVIQHTISPNNAILVGNPYASALDANLFITDNSSTTGTLYFWEHWGGESHYLANYQAGYATRNLAGGVAAVSNPDVSQVGSGTLIPGQYIPVGQGFFVIGSSVGGVVEFNNAQRVFKKESIVSDDSIFIKGGSEPEADIDDEIDRFYFKYTTSSGNQRELLLAIKEGLPEGVNYGYDAEILDIRSSDCFWRLLGSTNVNDKNLVIQSIGGIYDDLVLPLQVNVEVTGQSKLELVSSEIESSNVSMFLLDNNTNQYTEIELNTPIELALEKGNYKDRFSIVFKEEQVLSISDSENTNNKFLTYYSKESKSIVIYNKVSFSIRNIQLFNVLGKEVLNENNIYEHLHELKLPVNLNSGIYIMSFEDIDGVQFRKKLIVL